jgi:hypothetical protein
MSLKATVTAMLLDSLRVDVADFEARTGWSVQPQGLCQGDVCLPLPADAVDEGALDIEAVADRTGMPLVHDEAHDLWALGPAAGPDRRALTTAQAPELELPDLRTGERFRLSSLRGQKVLLIACASW